MDDEIDTETLQAQIDMSMAFAEELVASWIQPSASTSSTSKAKALDAEKELEAILRRPPRLGVGAPLPESTVSSLTGREAVRLKHKLEGKKRARTDDIAAGPSGGNGAESDDDAQESRAGAIRKKVKLDPFAMPGGKKGKGKAKEKDAGSDVQKANGKSGSVERQAEVKVKDVPDPGKVAKGEAYDRMDVDRPESVGEQSSEHLKKKRKRNKKHDSDMLFSSTQPAAAVEPSLTQSTPTGQPKPTHVPPTPSSPSHSLHSPSARPTPISSPPKLVSAHTPVLNLTGPPPAIEPEGVDTSGKPKKKRNRHKKKRASEAGAIVTAS